MECSRLPSLLLHRRRHPLTLKGGLHGPVHTQDEVEIAGRSRQPKANLSGIRRLNLLEQNSDCRLAGNCLVGAVNCIPAYLARKVRYQIAARVVHSDGPEGIYRWDRIKLDLVIICPIKRLRVLADARGRIEAVFRKVRAWSSPRTNSRVRYSIRRNRAAVASRRKPAIPMPFTSGPIGGPWPNIPKTITGRLAATTTAITIFAALRRQAVSAAATAALSEPSSGSRAGPLPACTSFADAAGAPRPRNRSNADRRCTASPPNQNRTVSRKCSAHQSQAASEAGKAG